jgi:hypothetical protein
LRSSPSAGAPKTLRVFINRDDLDFDGADRSEPTQEFELSQTSEVQELPVRRMLFARVRRLTLYFVNNFSSTGGSDSDTEGSDEEDSDEEEEDAEVTRLTYLGFKGEWMQLGRAPINILYELAANPNDHALKGTSANPSLSHNGV